MQLLHMWSYTKKWEKFGILRVCRVLSRLPSPRTRDKSIVEKFQQQNYLTILQSSPKSLGYWGVTWMWHFAIFGVYMNVRFCNFWGCYMNVTFCNFWGLYECEILQLRPPEWIWPSTRGFPTVTATSASATMGSVSTLGRSPKLSASLLRFTCRWRSGNFLFCPNCISQTILLFCWSFSSSLIGIIFNPLFILL